MSKGKYGQSAKDSITDDEYMQLVGLRTAHDYQYKICEALQRAAIAITAEVDEEGKKQTMGHTVDFICGSRDLDELLELLGLKRTVAVGTAEADQISPEQSEPGAAQ